MKKYIYLFIIAIMCSCTDLSDSVYDKIPQEKFPEDGRQLESVSSSIYKEVSKLFDSKGWWFLAQEATSDAIIFPKRGNDWGSKYGQLNAHNWNSETKAVKDMWGYLYSPIVRANQALDQLNQLQENELTLTTIAQVKVVRAFLYYLLIDNYGAVPYVVKYEGAETNPRRVKRADLCNELISEVEENIDLLPEQGTDKTRINKATAHMLLAKLYLNAKIYRGQATFEKVDMDKVIEHTNAVIDLGYYSLENNRLAPFKIENSNCSENIFTVPFDEKYYEGFRLTYRTLHTLHAKTYDLANTPWNGCCVVPSYYDKYFAANDGYSNPDLAPAGVDASEIVDPRSNSFLRGQQYASDGTELSMEVNDVTTPFILTKEIKSDVLDEDVHGYTSTRFSGYRLVKFEVKFGAETAHMSNDFPIFRLADAYLMRAEANLRGGTNATNTAKEDLDVIRDAANPNLEDLDANLDNIYAERAREMFLEGHRRQDMIRFGKFLSTAWVGKPVETDESRLILMLPEKETSINPNLLLDPIDL